MNHKPKHVQQLQATLASIFDVRVCLFPFVSVAEPDEDCVSYASALPVKGEAFCDCYNNTSVENKKCNCGEDCTADFEWTWDSEVKSPSCMLLDGDKEVMFHVDYSSGTAAVRATDPVCADQNFWEIKMTSPVYGTDMMIGIGTTDTSVDKYSHTFCSLLGRDGESWGLSYSGVLYHKGQPKKYSSKFGQGTIVGVHLDMWRGELRFYKNRRPLGVAFTGLQAKKMYPFVSSTAARSGMRVITTRSFPSSLQFFCCRKMREVIPDHLDVTEVMPLPPGLKHFLRYHLHWLLRAAPPARFHKKRSNSYSSKSDEHVLCKKVCD
ncbi:PREDICTED: SPRY domain-containing SOCS box protein 3-like [Priapulus caudatus]|uniref:SPRY domain-containing SOCS box protein 3 n=1 Tax=Priapulus caudatus TaxID=37621 RepID=A0ABM1DNR0_PRICU|nr:PREDICTED: SPRY domain-containing SOCS box protein 3-like [Priapulus caudatus]